MIPAIPFALESSAYRIAMLKRTDAARLQPLFEACADYAILESGEPPVANAAEAEFDATPPGRTTADKFMLGLYDGKQRIVGLLSADRDWPEPECWWIGLMLVDPDHRGTGIAHAYVEGFCNWVAGQGARRIELAVFDENKRADRFWRLLGFQHLRSTEARAYGRKTHVLHVMCRQLGR